MRLQLLLLVLWGWLATASSGVSCPLQHSCRQVTPPTSCRCDALCALHHDCCLDSPWLDQGITTTAACFALHSPHKQALGSMVVTSCPPGTDPLVSSACSRLPPDWIDPWLQTPVTDTEGSSFANAYCALCHGADLQRLKRWELLLLCPTLAGLELNDQDVHRGLHRRTDEKWVVEWAGQEHPCTLVVGGPPLGTPLRPCLPYAKDSCPPDGSRDCPQYLAPVVSGPVVYRNPHCALCHGEELQKVSCPSSQIPSTWFNFKTLFVVPTKDQCGPNQRFDPNTKTCRNLRCMQPGYVVKANGCVKAD